MAPGAENCLSPPTGLVLTAGTGDQGCATVCGYDLRLPRKTARVLTVHYSTTNDAQQVCSTDRSVSILDSTPDLQTADLRFPVLEKKVRWSLLCAL